VYVAPAIVALCHAGVTGFGPRRSLAGPIESNHSASHMPVAAVCRPLNDDGDGDGGDLGSGCSATVVAVAAVTTTTTMDDDDNGRRRRCWRRRWW